MSKTEVTEGELREALTDLLYDYGMVLGCRLLLVRRRGRPIEDELEERLYRNALLESMTIRWRSLMDFFYGHAKRKRHPNDICALHYLSKWPNGHDPSQVSGYNALRRRVDVQIAHIGRQRILQRTRQGVPDPDRDPKRDETELGKNGWDLSRLVEIAVALMRDFDQEAGERLIGTKALPWALRWEDELARRDRRFRPALLVARAGKRE